MDLDFIWARNAQLPETTTKPVQDLIEHTASEHPSRCAISAWDGNFEYGQLFALSAQVADYIVDKKVRPGTVLPIFMKKSKWMPVALLGVLRASCGVTLVDYNSKVDRLNEIVRVLEAPFIITTSDQESTLEMSIGRMNIDSFPILERPPVSIPQYRKRGACDVAAVVFTSGSTGSPKGVMLDHDCLSTTAVHGGKLFHLDARSRVFQFASYSFDISLHETLMTLVAGGCLCIPSEQQKLNDVVSAIEIFNANWTCITPSVASAVLSHIKDTSLETIVLTGEPIPARVCETLHVSQLYSWYGASEAPLASVCKINAHTWSPSQLGSGEPGNCWIVNPEDTEELCAVGQIGELLIEGPMVAKGYLNSSEKTKAAFIDSPSWLVQSRSREARCMGRLYKTGDLVSYNADGTLKYISRKDTMVKIRGQRVELSETEKVIYDVLQSDDDLNAYNVQVIVEAITPDQETSAVLVACMHIRSDIESEQSGIGQHNGRAGSNERMPIPEFGIVAPNHAFKTLKMNITRRLNQVMPSYMIPTAYIQVTSMPMTGTGKIDRKIIRSLLGQLPLEHQKMSRVLIDNGYTSPSTQSEQVLCRLWSQVLALEQSEISSTINFLDCGGDSLKAMTLVKAIQKEFAVSLKFSEVMRKDSNIQTLALLITEIIAGNVKLKAGFDLTVELDRWVARIAEKAPELNSRFCHFGFLKPTVLLTGATGYLGSRILGRLMKDTRVGRIIVLVRAKGMVNALERIRNAIWMSGLDEEIDLSRLDLWPGDLSKPRCGLTEDRWNQLDFVDVIIHNGAVVNWGADFRALEAVNIGSTSQLLRLALGSHHLRRFIYVSGGVRQACTQSDSDYRSSLNQADGYSQTKYISEQLTMAASRLYNRFAGLTTPPNPSDEACSPDRTFRVIKPGFIIGDRETGQSNMDDYLWRLVAGAVRMQAFPLDPAESWLDLVEVGHVAQHIIDQCSLNLLNRDQVMEAAISDDSDCENSQPSDDLGCYRGTFTMSHTHSTSSKSDGASDIHLDRGLPVSRFWAVIQVLLNRRLVPQKWDTWISNAQQDMEIVLEDHPLWGVQQFLGPRLGSTRMRYDSDDDMEIALQEMCDYRAQSEVEAAVVRCVQYLIDVKFITFADEVTTTGSDSSYTSSNSSFSIRADLVQPTLNLLGNVSLLSKCRDKSDQQQVVMSKCWKRTPFVYT